MISTVLLGPVGPSAVPRSYCRPSTVGRVHSQVSRASSGRPTAHDPAAPAKPADQTRRSPTEVARGRGCPWPGGTV